jgi:3-oxoacyl-[acyl-carrier-protein] synthase II
MAKAYINGISCISAQNSIDDSWYFDSITPANGDYFNAIEPSYKDHIAPNLIRRMGRAIKMGVTTANLAIIHADAKKVDAIITGTGLGCFEDSERFLIAMLDNNEQFLTPTSFIQSTHNTVGSQIALIMKCHDYNFTYVHRGFSFESCILDALMLFEEGKETILVGGIDEHTPNFVTLNRRAQKLQLQDATIPIHLSTANGVQLSEGSAFFLLSKYKSDKSIASINGIKTLYKPKSSEDIFEKLIVFLKLHNLTLSDIDITLMGFCGNQHFDTYLNELLPKLAIDTAIASFKNLCGEFYTASAFAMWVATKLIQKQQLPHSIVISGSEPKHITHVLVINQYVGVNYSFMLMSQC